MNGLRTLQSTLAAFGLVVLVTGTATAVDITACGQIVPAHEVGVLQSDLVCTGHGLAVRASGTLQLAGHSITGDGDIGETGVVCSGPNGRATGRCTIQGPGTISGFGRGVNVISSVVLRDLVVTGNGDGIYSPAVPQTGDVDATNVDASGNAGIGIRGRKVIASFVTASNNGGAGIVGETRGVVGSDIVADGNGSSGIVAFRNSSGIFAFPSAKISNVQANGNAGPAIYAGRVKLAGVTASGNAFGVFAAAGKIESSTISANPSGDVIGIPRRYRVFGLTCDHSYQLGIDQMPIGTLGICALD